MFEFDGSTYSLAEMIAVNSHDEAFCEFAFSADCGDSFMGCTRIDSVEG